MLSGFGVHFDFGERRDERPDLSLVRKLVFRDADQSLPRERFHRRSSHRIQLGRHVVAVVLPAQCNRPCCRLCKRQRASWLPTLVDAPVADVVRLRRAAELLRSNLLQLALRIQCGCIVRPRMRVRRLAPILL